MDMRFSPEYRRNINASNYTYNYFNYYVGKY